MEHQNVETRICQGILTFKEGIRVAEKLIKWSYAIKIPSEFMMMLISAK